MCYTIGEVSEMLDLPSSTIRYYDKQGLLPFLERESGIRKFSDGDISSLRLIDCLKKTGMPIKDIQQFSVWLQQGDDSIKERMELFQERRRIVEQQMKDLEKTLELIEHKCWYYETAYEAGTLDIHKK